MSETTPITPTHDYTGFEEILDTDLEKICRTHINRHMVIIEVIDE